MHVGLRLRVESRCQSAGIVCFAMQDDAGLKTVAVAWGLMWGVLLFPVAIGFAWIGRSAAVRSLRWPLVVLFVCCT